MTSYPTGEDILALLTESGVDVPSQMGLDVYAAEAVALWETGTGYRPFLAAAEETELRYDPPGPNRRGAMRGGGCLLFLNTGFVTLAAVTLDSITLEEEIDYRRIPYNAADRPTTAIEFTTPTWGKPGSVTVRGRVGYSDTLGADVWSAIRKLAASLALAALQEGSGNALMIQSGQDKIRYDTARQWGLAWNREARLAMAAKRLVC